MSYLYSKVHSNILNMCHDSASYVRYCRGILIWGTLHIYDHILQHKNDNNSNNHVYL